MSERDQSILNLRDTLKFLPAFRKLVNQLRAQEEKYREQNQSPDSSVSVGYVRILNSDYLSKTELVYLCFLCYYLNTTTLKASCPYLLCELLVSLPEKIERSDFTQTEKNSLFLLVAKRVKLYIDGDWPFSSREIGGIINDSQIARKLRRRTYQKLRPRKARRTQRHRGYRDHGSARPPHRWKPKFDISFTEQQNRIEEERKRCQAHFQLIIKDKHPVAIEDFPTIFDK